MHHVGRFGVLEDQLCAFTTAGYRGEGSPDHADALVFAVTELMLKDNAPILEFYRRQAEERTMRRPGLTKVSRHSRLMRKRLAPRLDYSRSRYASFRRSRFVRYILYGGCRRQRRGSAVDAKALIANGFLRVDLGQRDDAAQAKSALRCATDSGGAASSYESASRRSSHRIMCRKRAPTTLSIRGGRLAPRKAKEANFDLKIMGLLLLRHVEFQLTKKLSVRSNMSVTNSNAKW